MTQDIKGQAIRTKCPNKPIRLPRKLKKDIIKTSGREVYSQIMLGGTQYLKNPQDEMSVSSRGYFVYVLDLTTIEGGQQKRTQYRTSDKEKAMKMINEFHLRPNWYCWRLMSIHYTKADYNDFAITKVKFNPKRKQ